MSLPRDALLPLKRHEIPDYAKAAATRIGRKDWANALIGAYFGWAATHMLDSSIAQTILDAIVAKFTWLWSRLW